MSRRRCLGVMTDVCLECENIRKLVYLVHDSTSINNRKVRKAVIRPISHDLHIAEVAEQRSLKVNSNE
ncbi:hypothetical protein ACTXT7_011598 [Hymenolepis weldensis]